MRILVVDDHPIVRAGCQRMLKQAFGAEIIEAGTCREACRLALESAPDMVVLDLTLPGASGLEVLDKLLVQNDRLRHLLRQMWRHPPLLQHIAGSYLCLEQML